jgi:hypothetical protein
MQAEHTHRLSGGVMKIRIRTVAGVALVAAAIAAPGASAYVATGDLGGSPGQVATGDISGSNGQVAHGDGNSSSGQVVVGGGNGQSARPESKSGDSSSMWLSALVASSALAALGVAAAAMTRRRTRHAVSTLTI